MKPIIKQDNTTVYNPLLINPIMRQLRQGEAYINDQGKKIIVKNNNQSIQPDYRTPSDRVKAQRKFKEREKEQREVKEKEALSGFLTFIAPSTYIGPVFNSNNKSYTENVISGEGTGNTEANLAIDMLAPFAIGSTNKIVQSSNRFYKIYQFSKAIDNSYPKLEQIPLNVGWGPRQTIPVTHKSDKALQLSLYNELRWDVINENANPLGIWFQGKFGIPRSTNTGATLNKAQKALKARQMFSRRPYTHSGDLTLDKPLVTVGDVPNRSLLSYQAERLGADGLVYNDVYDNGYDANQVILSFKQPDNYMLTARAYKGGPRKSSDYEFFTTDPRYAHNYGQVKPYYIQSQFPVVTEEPLMGSKDPITMDMFINRVLNGNRADAIIGHDKVTGEFPYTSQGDEIMIFNPSQARLVEKKQIFLKRRR